MIVCVNGVGCVHQVDGSVVPQSRKNEMRDKLAVLKKAQLAEYKKMAAKFTEAVTIHIDAIVAEKPTLVVDTIDAGANAKVCATVYAMLSWLCSVLESLAYRYPPQRCVPLRMQCCRGCVILESVLA